MNSQPSLQGMHDILLPPPVPWWPATPAWAALGVVLLTLLLWVCWRALRRWRRDAYRRAALRDLTTGGHLPALLKRTALAAFPRNAVASLSGEDWAAFLSRTAPIAAADAAILARLAYLDPTEAAVAGPRARNAARRWIARHDRAAA